MCDGRDFKDCKDAGIKAAFSFAAPGKASDIQYIIEQLGYACKKYEGAGYDYIGVNIYPDTHNDNYVKTLKNTVEEKAAGKQMIISSVKCPKDIPQKS